MLPWNLRPPCLSPLSFRITVIYTLSDDSGFFGGGWGKKEPLKNFKGDMLGYPKASDSKGKRGCRLQCFRTQRFLHPGTDQSTQRNVDGQPLCYEMSETRARLIWKERICICSCVCMLCQQGTRAGGGQGEWTKPRILRV